MTVLLLAEHNNAVLNAATAKTLTAARQLAEDAHILVAGSECRPAAEAAAKLEGVTKVLIADAPHLANPVAEDLCAVVVPLMAGYDAFLAPATAFGKNVAPRVAALLDVMQVSDIISVKAPNAFERPIYAGNAIETVECSEPKIVATVRTSAFAATPEGGPGAPIDTAAVPPPSERARFVGADLTATDRPELASAKVVISAGRGIGNSDNFKKLIEPIADRLGAAIGASRAAVDSGYAPNDMQVGQTGKVVAPDLYIAIGISGAIQHLAGMKDSKVIVAINKDAEAPIFQVADYGLVADLFQALPELEAELKKAGR